jgi:hypothetical protein
MKLFQVHARIKTDNEIERDAASKPDSYETLEHAVLVWLDDQDNVDVVELEKGVRGLRLIRRVPREEVVRISRLLRRHR